MAADRVSTEKEIMATFDTMEDAQAYAKKRSTHTFKVYAGQMTQYKWETRRVNVPHNP